MEAARGRFAGCPPSTTFAAMLIPPRTTPPPDAAERRAAKPIFVYAVERLPAYDAAFYDNARAGMAKIGETIVPPREGRAFDVPAGHFFRIVSIDGPQVGDLNLWNAADLARTILQRQDTGAQRDPCEHGRPAMERAALFEADGDDYTRHARLVRLRRRRRRRPRCDRHSLRPLYQPPPDRRRLPSLLPFEPDARAGGSDEAIRSRGGAACP